MDPEICGPVTRASVRSSKNHKLLSSKNTDTSKPKKSKLSDGKDPKLLHTQICGRCRELKIQTHLAQDHEKLLPPPPSSTSKEAIAQNSTVWTMPWLEGEDGKAKLQRILFDIDFPFIRDCAVCEYLAEILEKGFVFKPFSDDDIHALGMLKSEYKDNSISFECNRTQIQLYSSKELDVFGSHGMANYPRRVVYWIGDEFGVAAHAYSSPDRPPRLPGCLKVQAHSPDYSLLLGWLNECHQQHIACKPRSSNKLRSIRLIDVESRSIVAYPPACPVDYLALSYVWGVISPKSFGLGSLPNKLPTTIEDAIEVTRQLKFQYLWVDYVCIDQKDDAHKETQISLMDDIYSGAFATIISLNSKSADDGIPRVGTRAQVIPQATVDCGRGNKIISKMPPLWKQLRHSIWATRGWTFQEGILSNRRLVFTRHQVYFSCNTLNCSESIGHFDSIDPIENLNDSNELCDGALQNPLANGNQSTTPLTEVYGKIISSCAERKLSHHSDALNAVSGVLKMLERLYFPEGFFHGLPRAYFRDALLWRRGMKNQLIENNHDCWARRDGFPSWSWAGWQWNVPMVWLWRADILSCHMPQPPLRFWTQDGDPIISGAPPCSCPPPRRPWWIKEVQFTKLKTTFQNLSTLNEDFYYHNPTPKRSGNLTVRGVLVELEIVLSPEEVSPAAKGDLLYTIKLTTACSKALGSAEGFFYFDKPWESYVSEGIPKRIDLLLIAVNSSFPGHHLGFGLSLLLLDWKDGVAYRAGVVDLYVNKLNKFKLEAAKPRLQRFILG